MRGKQRVRGKGTVRRGKGRARRGKGRDREGEGVRGGRHTYNIIQCIYKVYNLYICVSPV